MGPRTAKAKGDHAGKRCRGTGKDVGKEVSHQWSLNSDDSRSGRRGGCSSAKVLNSAICKVAQSGDFEGLLDLVTVQGEDLTCVNMSTALHKLARFVKEEGHVVHHEDPRWLALHERIEAELHHQVTLQGRVHPRCLSTMAWAYATLQVARCDIVPVMMRIAKLSAGHIDQLNPLELTNLLWGFAKTKCIFPPVFHRSLEVLARDLSGFSSSNISTLVWALVTSQQHSREVLSLMVDEFVERVQRSDESDGILRLKPVELVNVLWSMATSSFNPRLKVLRVIGGKVIRNISAFKVQELSITAWSFSRLQARHDKLFAAIAAHLTASAWVLHQVHAQGVANLLWAFARQRAMGMEGGAFAHVQAAVRRMLAECWRLLPLFKPQEFASAFQALERLDLPSLDALDGEDGLFLTDAARRGLALMHRFSGSQCTNLLMSFAGLLESRMVDRVPSPEVMVAFLDGLAAQGGIAPGSPRVAHLSARVAQVRVRLHERGASPALPSARRSPQPLPPGAQGGDADWQRSSDDHFCEQPEGDQDLISGQSFMVIDEEEPLCQSAPPFVGQPLFNHPPKRGRQQQQQQQQAEMVGTPSTPWSVQQAPQGAWQSQQGEAQRPRRTDPAAFRTNSPVRLSPYEQGLEALQWQNVQSMMLQSILPAMYAGVPMAMPMMRMDAPPMMPMGMHEGMPHSAPQGVPQGASHSVPQLQPQRQPQEMATETQLPADVRGQQADVETPQPRAPWRQQEAPAGGPGTAQGTEQRGLTMATFRVRNTFIEGQCDGADAAEEAAAAPFQSEPPKRSVFPSEPPASTDLPAEKEEEKEEDASSAGAGEAEDHVNMDVYYVKNTFIDCQEEKKATALTAYFSEPPKSMYRCGFHSEDCIGDVQEQRPSDHNMHLMLISCMSG